MGAPTDREMFRAMGKECMAFRIRRASRLVTRLYDQILADVGLTATQLTLLAAVANRPDLRMAELAELLGFEPSSLSRAVAFLVKKKWLRPVPSSDKRERLFELTDAGREIVRAAWPRWLEAQQEMERAIADVPRFVQTLDGLSSEPAGRSAIRGRGSRGR